MATAEIEGQFASGQIDLALVQEPQLTDNPAMGCRVKKIPGTTVIQSSKSFNRPGARAAIYIRSDVGRAIKMIALEQFSNRDIATIQVELMQGGNPLKMIICSLYCPRLDADGNCITDPTSGKLKEVVFFANTNRIPIMIGADANAHNPQWGGNKMELRGVLLEEFCLLEGQLQILNTGGAVTYERFGANAATSSIDVTICSETISDCVIGWKTQEGFRGSDHRPISMEFLATKPKAGITKVKSSTNWKKFAAITGKNLNELRDVFVHSTNVENLDLAALAFGKTLRCAYEACTRSRKVTCNFKREWYSKELDTQRKKINRIQNKMKRAKQAENEALYLEALVEFKFEKNDYKKQCSKQKYKSWKQMADGLEEIKDTARLQKILEKKATSNMGTVRKADGSYTLSIEETQEELMKAHLPGCTRLDDQAPSSLERLLESDMVDLISRSRLLRHRNSASQTVNFLSNSAKTEIIDMTSKGNIEWAIASFKPNKAPGPDGITPNMLKKAGTSVVEPLSLMFENSAKLGHIPEEWSSASVAFIPKAGKASYDDTGSYRAISLMSFVLKTMEKLIDNKLRKVDRLDEKIHKDQHAYREGKGTATALDDAATILENCLDKGGKALAVYLDIKGAFDQTAYSTTTSSLEALGVKQWTISWIKSLLGNRKLQPSNKDSTRRYRPATGLPQGGCSSPLGWIVCADSLVKRLVDAGFDTVAYADDFKIIAKKGPNEADVLSSQITRALRIVSDWCTRSGLSVNPNKVGLMPFFRGRKGVKNADKIDFGGTRLTPVDKFKFLGVYFDKKLHWDYHIEQAADKGRRATMIAAQYLRFSWGPSPKAALLIMNQVVVPRVLYGCGVWWHRAQLTNHTTRLDKLQRLMLRMVSGAFHTTPTADLLRIFDIESLSLRAKKLALDESLRLTELGGRKRSESTKGHRGIDLTLRQLVNANNNSDSIQKTWNIQRLYRVIINERANWQAGLSPADFTDVWYSDGSKKDEAVGVGCCDARGMAEIALRVSGHSTIMQAEMTGIRLCADSLNDATAGKRILILSDSQAALKALDNPVIRSETTRKCAALLNSIARRNEVTVGWIPGHSNHEGNERADRLANVGADRETVDLEIHEATSSRSAKITDWTVKKKKAEWLRKRPDNGMYARLLIDGFGKGKGNIISNKRRAQIRARISILTGHARTNKYILRAKGEGDGQCRFCSMINESIEHLFADCQRLGHIRHETLGSRALNVDQLALVGLEKLIKFSKEAGFYDMLACDMRVS